MNINNHLNGNNYIPLPSDQDSSGRTLGAEEVELLQQVVSSGTLTSTKGSFTKTLEKEFANILGVKYAYACASGSAAVHIAIAAIDPNPGDEIITTSITDMGALTPILYQGAIPVFADVDPRTCNVTAETIRPCISPKTKAIIVTHLFGNPCEMTEIMELSKQYNIPVIEDSAQSFLAKHNDQYVATFGGIGCFSLQQGKHITTGEGGIVVTNDDYLARRLFLLINKAFGYGDPNPDHYFLALNYRISELQSAVALAQLKKLNYSVDSRRQSAEKLSSLINDIPGIQLPYISERNMHTYWKYCLRIDGNIINGGAVELAKLLKEQGIFSAPRYIQKPAFMCEIFREQRTFGNSRYPFTLARPEALDYRPERFPGTYSGLEAILVLPWNECYTCNHVEYIADSIRLSAKRLMN